MSMIFTIGIILILIFFLTLIAFGIFCMFPYVIEGIGETIYEYKKLKDKMKGNK